jgi:hypothetical protein
MRWLVVIAMIAAVGCGKKNGNSDKAREIYRCWELGWQVVESCYKGRPAAECDDFAAPWFETNKDVTVLDGNSAFDSQKERCAKTTGLSSWNALTADDITDDMADALQDLQAGVKSHDLLKIRAARTRVRAALELP